SVVLSTILGVDDDDTYNLRVIRRVARRQGGGERTDGPGVVFLEIDRVALPVLPRARRGGGAPEVARPLGSRPHPLPSREPRPTRPRRPRAKPASCSVRTTTSPRSAGSRRIPDGS